MLLSKILILFIGDVFLGSNKELLDGPAVFQQLRICRGHRDLSCLLRISYRSSHCDGDLFMAMHLQHDISCGMYHVE